MDIIIQKCFKRVSNVYLKHLFCKLYEKRLKYYYFNQYKIQIKTHYLFE